VPVDDLAGFAYRRGELERLYRELMSLGRVLSLSWILAVWAAGAVESELRCGGRGGTMPLVEVFLRGPSGCEGRRRLPNMTVSR
jgi:hypothetical protein